MAEEAKRRAEITRLVFLLQKLPGLAEIEDGFCRQLAKQVVCVFRKMKTETEKQK